MAKRRSKKDDMLIYPHTPERQMEHSSGWCMTKDHDGCRYQFDHGKCGCDCHRNKKNTADFNKNSTLGVDPEDPRPWKV